MNVTRRRVRHLQRGVAWSYVTLILALLMTWAGADV